MTILNIKKNNFNKENLWQDYDLENGYENLNKKI